MTVPEYPIALAAKLIQGRKASWDDVAELIHQTKRIHDEAQRLSAQAIELEIQNLRLQHENDFLLRLISERDT